MRDVPSAGPRVGAGGHGPMGRLPLHRVLGEAAGAPVTSKGLSSQSSGQSSSRNGAVAPAQGPRPPGKLVPLAPFRLLPASPVPRSIALFVMPVTAGWSAKWKVSGAGLHAL